MKLSANLKKLVCAVSACAICLTSVSAAGLGIGTVTGDVVNVRSGASLSAAILTQLRCGTEVNVLAEESGWYRVEYGSTEGYMCADYVKLIPETADQEEPEAPEDDALYGVITGSCVRFRKGPSTLDAIIREVGVGTKFTILGEADGWTHVLDANGTEGYIKSDYIRTYSLTDADSDTAAEIIEFAMGYLGTTYRYAGASPSGFDCSGFIYYVFGSFGYSLHRTAADQYSYDGEYVAKEDLQPGDLLYFDYGGVVGHVGMYIGDGEFIHSSSSSEYCVTISRLDNATYTRRYVGAKRVL